ncbi:DUF3369 domain-containing protein [Clostridium sp. SYSU_GA19001]|uniref:DUF3369 domain-containing protein n=1 Tax=Clostridium caldaquaticum TaxID=2940653 RepID=UPI0020775AE0|nr:DUF3369 domain-containing protein [Clostridium caldaquaticum]MCM8711233.1 DUF3369 domain-containing protein [Clostridium caldaquaticum]
MNDNIVFSDDNMLFAEEYNHETELIDESWKILIADDEKEVHSVTKLVLSDFQFQGKGLKFYSAYSAQEAMELMRKNKDIAIILLDVVMEEEDSGLKVIKYVREVLQNNDVRIILRTGQPGQAPEKKVIVEYDINDYKEKTELTAQKLYTCIVTSLRTYRDIKTINTNKKGLDKIIQSSSRIFQIQSMTKFSQNVLIELSSLLNLNKNDLCYQVSGFAATKDENDFYIFAATGDYSKYIYNNVKEVVSLTLYSKLYKAVNETKNIFSENEIIMFFKSQSGLENIIYLKSNKKINDIDINFIEIFCNNISIACDNIYLNKEIENTQKEIIFTLGEIVEARSKETGNHVRRVAEYSKLLAQKYGLNEKECELIKLASPMHDIGKIAIPDNILNKPGKLNDKEFDIIKNHCVTGYDMLKNSNKEIMKTAAIIAHEHHERYNGKGYPNGLKGEEIHIYGRITAIADVFDALCSRRVYKNSWSVDESVEYIKSEKGEHFDPVLVDIFTANIDKFINIKEQLKDYN